MTSRHPSPTARLSRRALLWIAGAGLALGAAALVLAVPSDAQVQPPERPRLVVQITVDQLRSDLIARYSAGYGPGGFQRLLAEGIFFADAHQRHANTETVVGHTTLVTGTDPAVHGMVANNWRQLNRSDEGAQTSAAGTLDVSTAYHYATRDDDYRLLMPDNTPSTDATSGRSPADLLSSTIGDQFKLTLGPDAKVFGVSMKDRAAVAIAGHAGTAYWFADKPLSFVTSTFYMDAYPDWAADWNARKLAQAYAGTEWTLLLDPSYYLFADADDAPWETFYPGWTRVFPHRYGALDGPLFAGFIRTSPAADTLTLSFVRELIEGEGLGEDEVTDFLAISLNSTDYVGHAFGPSSLEAEDNLKRLDRTLEGFFDYLDMRFGLGNVLIVLSSDHGAAEVPGYLQTMLNVPSGIFDFSKVEARPAIRDFKTAHGLEKALGNYAHPYIYLDYEELLGAGLIPARVAELFAREVAAMDGIRRTYTHAALSASELSPTPLNDAVLANFQPERAGDVYVVMEPGWFPLDPSPAAGASQHGSPWAYDSHIPVFFMGPDVAPGRVARRVEAVDVAPTIATLMSLSLPSGTRGVPLEEVVE